MDTILVQLQQLMKTSPNENPNTLRDTDTGAFNQYENKDKEEEVVFHLNIESSKSKDKELEDIYIRFGTLTHKDVLQKVGIMRPYSPEWDLVPFPKNYGAPSFDKYYGK